MLNSSCRLLLVHLAKDREDTGDVLPGLLELGSIFQLSGDVLKSQVELTLLKLSKLLLELIPTHISIFTGFHKTSVLATKRVGIGSFAEARPSASLATASGTPLIS
jgi:hypothetical protein